MRRYRLNRKSALCLLSTLIPAVSWGGGGPQQGDTQQRRPPREAFAACANRSEGDMVAITTPQGTTMKAICRTFEGQLAAVPVDAPPVPPGGERVRSDN
jgi:hypothetical protein